MINETILACKVFRFRGDHVEFNLTDIPELRGLIDDLALLGRGMRYIVPPSVEDAQQQLAVLQRLQSVGLVTALGDSAEPPGNAWVLIEEGVAFVRPVYHLRNPQSVLQARFLEGRQEGLGSLRIDCVLARPRLGHGALAPPYTSAASAHDRLRRCGCVTARI